MKKTMHSRKREQPRKDSRRFHKTTRPHQMNRVVSFVSGKGIFRGGVQV